MPAIITRGAASASGFGFAAAGGGSITYNTPGTYTWVAPTTLVKTLVGTGGSGSTTTTGVGFYRNDSGYSGLFRNTGSPVGYTTSMPSSGAVSTSASTSALIADLTNLQVSYNGGVTWVNAGGSGYYASAGLYQQSSATGVFQGTTLDYSTIISVVTSIVSTWSSTVTSSTTGNTVGYITLAQYYYFNGNLSGGNSSALGNFFLGATGSTTPTTTTYTNLAVTLGASYTIVVGANQGAATSQIKLTW